MVSRKLVVVCGVAIAIAGCKGPSLDGDKKEVAGPPPRAPETSAAAPAPMVTAAAPAPSAPAASPAAADCACDRPVQSALPASIHDAPRPTAAAARPALQRVSTHRPRTPGRRPRYDAGYDRAEPAGDTRTDRYQERSSEGYVAGDRSYEAQVYESEHASSSYQSSHEGGYGPGYPPGGYVEHKAYGYRWGEPGGGYAHPQDYTVSRGSRGDVHRSRAWTQVQCGC